MGGGGGGGGADLGQNCLQKLSADDTSRQRVNNKSVFLIVKNDHLDLKKNTNWQSLCLHSNALAFVTRRLIG